MTNETAASMEVAFFQETSTRCFDAKTATKYDLLTWAAGKVARIRPNAVTIIKREAVRS